MLGGTLAAPNGGRVHEVGALTPAEAARDAGRAAPVGPAQASLSADR